MEANLRWSLVAALAPIAWGTTYFVTREVLPADHPLYGALLRALPAGVILLAVARKLPTGSWWWKSLVLGTLNMGAFFALIYVAAQLLPTSIASTIMATSPMAMMLLAWAMVAERPRILSLIGAAVGLGGVGLLLAGGGGAVHPVGVLASLGAMLMSSVGYVLAKRWNSRDVDVLASTSWQLIAGGLMLLPAVLIIEKTPPVLDVPAILGFAYVSIIATALAFAAWFLALRHLSAGTVGLIGLLNPVTGVVLGTAIAGDLLDPAQWLGLVLVFTGVALGQPLLRRLRVVHGVGPRSSRQQRHAGE